MIVQSIDELAESIDSLKQVFSPQLVLPGVSEYTIAHNAIEILQLKSIPTLQGPIAIGRSEKNAAGLLLTTDGYILTAAHVANGLKNTCTPVAKKIQEQGVMHSLKDLYVHLVDIKGKAYFIDPTVIITNDKKDFGIIKAVIPEKARPYPYSVSDIHDGEKVIVQGLQNQQQVYGEGQIVHSSTNRPQSDFEGKKRVLHDIAVAHMKGMPGFSGMAVSNISGDLVGIIVGGNTQERVVNICKAASLPPIFQFIGNHMHANLYSKGAVHYTPIPLHPFAK